MGWEQWLILVMLALAFIGSVCDPKDSFGYKLLNVSLNLLLLIALISGGFFSGGYEDGYIDACKSVGGMTLHTAEGEPICVTEVHNVFSR